MVRCAIISRVTDLGALAARLPAQVLGLLLVLAPAVVATGSGNAAARVLAILAGLVGAGLVFGGLKHRLDRQHRVNQGPRPSTPEGDVDGLRSVTADPRSLAGMEAPSDDHPVVARFNL